MSNQGESRAIVQGLLAVGAGVGNNALIAALSALPVMQILLLRAGGAVVLLLPLVLWAGLRRPSPFALLRAVIEAIATLLLVVALVTVPLSLVATIMMTIPLGVMWGATLFLGERLTWVGQLLVVAGFAGAALATAPAIGGDTAGAAAALGSAGCFVIRDLMTRRRRERVSALEMSFCASVVTLLFALLAGGYVDWLPINSAYAAALAGMIALYVASNLLIVAATRNGRPAIIAATRYSSVIWAILLDALVFASWPHPATAIGATVIVVCGVVLIWSENRPSRSGE